MGSHITSNSQLKPSMISFGNPCREYKFITEDYETKVKKPGAEEEETEDEYNSILPGFGQEENEKTEIYSKPENTVVPQYKEDSENVSSVNNVKISVGTI